MQFFSSPKNLIFTNLKRVEYIPSEVWLTLQPMGGGGRCTPPVVFFTLLQNLQAIPENTWLLPTFIADIPMKKKSIIYRYPVKYFFFRCEVLGIKIRYKGCVELISEGIFGKYSKMVFVLIFFKGQIFRPFSGLAPSKLKLSSNI